MSNKRRHEMAPIPTAEVPTRPAPTNLIETLNTIRINAQHARDYQTQTIIDLEAWRAEIDAAIAFLRANK